MSNIYQVRAAEASEAEFVASLAAQLWPEESEEILAQEFSDSIKNGEGVWLALDVSGKAIGFCHATLRREYVEGASEWPVAYLEGIFILPDFRQKGVGYLLLRAVESWGKENGCTELASDAEWHNLSSQAFHLATGFKEANRVVCYVKSIE